MEKTLKVTGYNVVAVDHAGNLNPINTEVYKNEGEIKKAVNDGSLVWNEAFAGVVILPVYTLAEVKPEPKKAADPKNPAPPKAPVSNATPVS